MKTKEIAKQHGIKVSDFDSWLTQSEFQYKVGALGGIDVDDTQDVDEIISAFNVYDVERQRAAQQAADEQQRAAQQAADEQQRAADEQQRSDLEMQQALSRILITSGFSFDGYTITKYSGYISGDDAAQVDRGQQGFFGGGTTDVGASLMSSLKEIRRNALVELKEAAHALGCNAVIGVDFDYITLDPETASSNGGTLYLPYVFGVTANGNAVIIEPS